MEKVAHVRTLHDPMTLRSYVQAFLCFIVLVYKTQTQVAHPRGLPHLPTDWELGQLSGPRVTDNKPV